jgi:FSR family fosmidomycin resistance protein-like MFS transporter
MSATANDRQTGRRVLFTASALHFANDACFALLYPLLPLIAVDLHLSYAQVGLVRATFSGAASVLQLPVGLLGERFGEGLILLLGNAWVGGGLAAMALAGGYAALLALTLIAGIGGNAQHPLGAATVALACLLLFKRTTVFPPLPVVSHLSTAVIRSVGGGFGLLLAAGALDSATQGAALTFLPFLFTRQGFDTAQTSILFGLIFAAGAAGKFLCGWLSDRWGPLAVIILTEASTAAALVGFAAGVPRLAVPLAILFGFVLSGTASALAMAVTVFVPAARRARGYGAFFTASLTGGAAAPLAYGVLGDRAGLIVVFVVMAASTACIVPVVLPLRRALATLR